MTCQAHPVLVKKANQVCGSFLCKKICPPVDGRKDPWPCVLSLHERFVGDPASLARDNIVSVLIFLIGMTMALWLNILGQHPGSMNRAVMSTKPSQNGHGFRIYWKKNQGLYIEIYRADGKEEMLKMAIADYPSSNSYGVWYHYTISYKYDGNNPSNIFHLYLDGTELNGLAKSVSTQGSPAANTGTVHIARNDFSIATGDDAHMKIDDLVFWERLLACNDVINLYETY